MPMRFNCEIQFAAILPYWQSVFQNPSDPNYYSPDDFFGHLLPAIARWALELPKHIDAAEEVGKLCLQSPLAVFAHFKLIIYIYYIIVYILFFF